MSLTSHLLGGLRQDRAALESVLHGSFPRFPLMRRRATVSFDPEGNKLVFKGRDHTTAPTAETCRTLRRTIHLDDPGDDLLAVAAGEVFNYLYVQGDPLTPLGFEQAALQATSIGELQVLAVAEAKENPITGLSRLTEVAARVLIAEQELRSPRNRHIEWVAPWGGEPSPYFDLDLTELTSTLVVLADVRTDINRQRSERSERSGEASAHRHVPASMAREVWDRDGYHCVSCGRRGDWTIDHVIPRSKGGFTVLENLVTRCRPCNSSKSDTVFRLA